jgi:hypothetical protein
MFSPAANSLETLGLSRICSRIHNLLCVATHFAELSLNVQVKATWPQTSGFPHGCGKQTQFGGFPHSQSGNLHFAHQLKNTRRRARARQTTGAVTLPTRLQITMCVPRAFISTSPMKRAKRFSFPGTKLAYNSNYTAKRAKNKTHHAHHRASIATNSAYSMN